MGKHYIGDQSGIARLVGVSNPGPIADPVLNNNSWEIISQVSQAGTASNYWSVGSSKEVRLQGNVQTVEESSKTISINILTVDVIIADLSSTSIVFMFGTVGNRRMSAMYNIHPMNRQNLTTAQTFADTDLSAFLSSETGLLACFPSDLFSVLKTVNVRCYNPGSTLSVLVATKLTVPSEKEVLGSSGVEPWITQLQWYAHGYGADNIFTRISANGTSVNTTVNATTRTFTNLSTRVIITTGGLRGAVSSLQSLTYAFPVMFFI